MIVAWVGAALPTVIRLATLPTHGLKLVLPSRESVQRGRSCQFLVPERRGELRLVLGSTNVALPLAEWSNLGPALETLPGSGQFQFTDPQATNHLQRCYRVKSP